MKTIKTSLWHFFIFSTLLFMASGCVSTLKVVTYKRSIKEYDMRYMATKSELEMMSSTLPFLRHFGFKPPRNLRTSFITGRSYYEAMGFSPITTTLCLIDLPFSLVTDTLMFYLDDHYYNVYMLPRELKKKEQSPNPDPHSRSLEQKEIADRQIRNLTATGTEHE